MSTADETYEKYLVQLATPCVYYIPSLFDSESANNLYDDLHKNVPWTKTAKINRWVALYENEPENDYKYRDAPAGGSISMTDTIRQIKHQVEECYHRLTGTRVSFNTCLANFYENGHQRIGWHTDREEIGRTTPIASVSLGAVRQFLVRHKLEGMTDRASIDLASGSVVFMENICQREYLHAVPKQTEVTKGRINLTFRCKTDETPGEEEHQRRDNWLENIAQGIVERDERHTDTHAVPLFGDDIRTDFSDPDSPNVCYTVSCNVGTENQVAAEVIEILDDEVTWEVVSTPFGIVGYVAICATRDAKSPKVVAKLLELRSAVNVMEYHDHFELHQVAEGPTSEIDGEALYQFYKKRLQANPDLITPLAATSADSIRTFRVTCERVGGPHAFQAPNVEFEIGGAMSEFYEFSKPKMVDHDVHCRVDVMGDKVMVGTQLNVEDLTKRHFLRHRNAVTIKTNLAYVMLRLANVQKGNLIVDPFCGSGTILLEALEMTQGNMRCIGLDVSRRTATGAAENAVAEGYSDPGQCSIYTCDARGLRKHVDDESADTVVSNLPWGVRTGHKQGVSDLQQTYEVFLRTAWYTLKPGARVVMLVLRGLQMIRILRKLGGRYRIISVMIVRTTNNLPAIVVVEKLGRDVLRESLKGQLSRFSKYVNVSAELYHAIHYEDIDEAN